MRKAIEAEEYYTPCFYYLGYTYGKEGKSEDASAMFKRAMEINPLDINIYIYKGRMYEETANLEEAAKAYRMALDPVVARED
jgi:tetratricopeptide (TPR) repeat protein